MTSRPPMPHRLLDQPPGASGATGHFVGIGLPEALAADLAGTRQILAIRPEDIATASLHQMPDSIVACLLLGGKTDAMDIIGNLSSAGYTGAVMVVAPPLPNPRMVERELNRAAKPMMVTLVLR